ncbi:MAG: winged helix-turn-helix domain-containing protein [Pseudodesulfovibrio sp.]
MLTQLFTSKTRIKLLLKLFLNPQVSCYLRELATEFSLSPNALKEELDSLSHAGYLQKEKSGRSTYFRANKEHPFFPEISSIVKKTLGIDRLIEQVIDNLGEIHAAYILDDYAKGEDSGLIDILLIGEIDQAKLEELIHITEKKIHRKIRAIAITKNEFSKTKDIFLKRPNWKVL